MAIDTYTGPPGGSWFDPANWSEGVIPAAGDIANVFENTVPTSDNDLQTGVDATAGTVSGLTVDLSGSAGSLSGSPDGLAYPFAPNLIVRELGTVDAPVTLDVTANNGTNSDIGLIMQTVDGAVDVGADQELMISPQQGDEVTINGDVTVDTGGTLLFEGNTFDGYPSNSPTTLNGRVFDDGGEITFDTQGVTGTGQIEIANGGTVLISDAESGEPLNKGITFNSSGGMLIFGYDPNYTGTITGFGAGDTIAGFKEDELAPITSSFSDGVLTVSQAGSIPNLFFFAGKYTIGNFDVTFSHDIGQFVITYVPCFASGSLIGTPSGDRSVEMLVRNDTVTLSTGDVARVIWVGHRRQIGGDVIRVRAHALGHHVPARDLTVSADHGLYLDGVLVQAGLLVNGETIVTEHRDTVTFYHVELEHHAILLAEGAPAESYLDTGNRRQFANCTLTYDPVSAAQKPCAEMVFAGERLEVIRARLEATVPA